MVCPAVVPLVSKIFNPMPVRPDRLTKERTADFSSFSFEELASSISAAPCCAASSSLSWSTSMAITEAPSAAAICTPNPPTPPTPTNTATSSAPKPERRIASKGVVTASATTDRRSRVMPGGRFSGTGQSPRAGTRTCVANPPSPSLPGMNCRRQMVGWPARQGAQSPQGITAGTITLRPSHFVAPSPAATMRPEISCPRVSGRGARVGTPSKAKPTSV